MRKLTEKDFNDFVTIGIALGAEKDLYTLLELILTKGQEILNAQASTLFLCENPGPQEIPQTLRFKLVKNDVVDAPFSEFTLPINEESLAGYVAKNRCILNIEDVYTLDGSAPFNFNPSFDQQTGFKSKSLLSSPLIDHAGALVGVVQFWNKVTDGQSQSFTPRDQLILKSLAGHAAISIENTQLHENIQNLFEGFIKASVSAIEARDPTTSGHSERVAQLTLALSREVSSNEEGPYRQVYFQEKDLKQIEYAALLHDFGKIGVREHVLVKAQKLFPYELEQIMDRIDLYQRDQELKLAQKKIEWLESGKSKSDPVFLNLDAQLAALNVRSEAMKQDIAKLNLPNVMPENIKKSLDEILSTQFTRPNGHCEPILSSVQGLSLNIPKGSLSSDERQQIEEHVSYTFSFLQQIPWTRELSRVSEIAYSHHEKLDGSGYPRGIKSKEIPVEAKIMTIADIYDALAAKDRPYKKALSPELAIKILNEEAQNGKLDLDLVQLFTRKNIHKSLAS